MTQTITPDELVSLNRTMASLYQAAERLEAAEMDRDHLASTLEKVARVFDDPDEGPEDFHQLPQAVEGLRLKCVTAGNHAACRLNVLKGIYHILGSDGGPTGENVLTGVPLELARLPKQIGQLLADVTTWRGRYNMMIAENGELVRENAAVKDAHHAIWKRLQLVEGENETLARNMPPEPPSFHETAIHEMQDRIVRKTAEAWLQDAPPADAAAPEPPLMEETPVVMTYDPACFRTTKVIGQAWCKTDRATNSAIRFNMHNDCIVLCDVHRDTTTGALTYRPLAMEDLPIVQ